METVMQMTVIGFAMFALCGAAAAGAPLDEFETPAMPTSPPATWLTYHLLHPGPGGATPGDPNPAFYYKGRYHLHYIYNHKEGCAFAHVSSTDTLRTASMSACSQKAAIWWSNK